MAAHLDCTERECCPIVCETLNVRIDRHAYERLLSLSKLYDANENAEENVKVVIRRLETLKEALEDIKYYTVYDIMTINLCISKLESINHFHRQLNEEKVHVHNELSKKCQCIDLISSMLQSFLFSPLNFLVTNFTSMLNYVKCYQNASKEN